jgi:two-component system sensor histidine kinase UhpB
MQQRILPLTDGPIVPHAHSPERIASTEIDRSGSSLEPASGSPLPPAGKTLKLRLSLLITSLLALVTMAGGIYIVRKARDDTQAEIRSTLTLAGHFLDAQLALLRDRPIPRQIDSHLFGLQDLGDIRHLSVRFYDNEDRLIDSNDRADARGGTAPQWFARLVRVASAPMPSETHTVSLNGRTLGHLVIAPDPTSETDEMWTTSSGLLGLLLLFFLLVNVLVWWAVARALRPIEQILHAFDELRRGNLGARLPQFGTPEMSRISVGFNHMAETLEQSLHENRRLTRRLLNTQESERTSLARELHDEIGQCVSAIHADAAAILNRGNEAVLESARAIVSVTAQIKDIVRSMLQRLRPPVLEGLGLVPALRELVAAFQQRNDEVLCSLRSSGELSSLGGEIGTTVYRIVQECLTNVARHAKACQVSVEVALLESPHTPDATRRVRVTVCDDGTGFFPSARHRGFGLTGIRERVSALGGNWQIDSKPGRGTRISVEVPLSQELDETP